MVSVPSTMPAAWKKDFRPRAPSSGSPRWAAITARPRNDAAVQTNDGQQQRRPQRIAGLAKAKPTGTAA